MLISERIFEKLNKEPEEGNEERIKIILKHLI